MRTWKDETIKRELNRLAEGLQEVDKTIISYVRISMGNLSDTRTVTVYTDFAKDEWLFKATFDFEVNTMTLECRGVEPCTNRISSLKRSVNACIETFNCTFDEFEYYYGMPYKHYLPTAEAEEIAEQSVQQEGRTLTVTLHPEDEEEEITITYEDAKGFHYVVGQEALEIEKSTDGISIDKDHVYIVIEFLDGSEATFRRSSVVRIAEEGHVLLERDPEPTPEEAGREVTYTDFKPEQDYEEERQKEIAETVAGIGLELLEEQLTELEKLEDESDKADDAWDKDPLNAELEAASDKAYEKEWKQYMDTVKTLVKLIDTDTKTARQMLQRGSKNREKVWNYLKRRKIYESK